MQQLPRVVLHARAVAARVHHHRVRRAHRARPERVRVRELAELPRASVSVGQDFSSIDQILSADLLISYTCDVRPTFAQQMVLKAFLERGGRWFALHGTNSFLDFDSTGWIVGLICCKAHDLVNM